MRMNTNDAFTVTYDKWNIVITPSHDGRSACGQRGEKTDNFGRVNIFFAANIDYTGSKFSVRRGVNQGVKLRSPGTFACGHQYPGSSAVPSENALSCWW